MELLDKGRWLVDNLGRWQEAAWFIKPGRNRQSKYGDELPFWQAESARI
jgi:hypothetical protein